MAQEIYHRSNWGIASNEWGNTYLNADLTNELYKRANNYENSWATDKILNRIGTKPSIIMTPTAYSDGKLYSVKPAQTLGEELVANGDFSNGGSSWSTVGVSPTFVNSTAILENGARMYSSNTTTLVNNYKVVISFSEISSGGITIYYGSAQGLNYSVQDIIDNGYKIEKTTKFVGNTRIYVYSSNADTYAIIDSVSIKEVTDADFTFTRNSSATRVNEKGLIENENTNIPRIDYTDGQGSLLLEPQRSNLVLTSASGTYGNSPASETNTISPDGTNNAVIPTPDSASDRYEYSISSGAYATNTKLAYSWYRKRISTPVNVSYVGDLHLNIIQNATQVGLTTQIQSDVNGFDRFQAIFNITDGSATSIIRGYFGSIIGTGNSSIAYWGHQLEVGSYATSYIPTSGSTITRAAETCNDAGNSDLINSTEGVLYAEISALNSTASGSQYISISDGTYNNRASILFSSGSTNRIRTFLRVGGASQIDTNNNVTDVTDFNKIAFSYKENDFKVYINGSLASSDTSGSVWSTNTITKLSFSEINSSANKFEGKTKAVAVFKEALTDEELQKLTTL